MTNLRIVLFQSILALQFQFLMATRQCVSTSSKYGFILVGSVFKSFPSESLHLCHITCQKNPVCQSLNYNAAENVCELSTEMSRSRPENFQQRKMFVYAEKLPDLSKQRVFNFARGDMIIDFFWDKDYLLNNRITNRLISAVLWLATGSITKQNLFKIG